MSTQGDKLKAIADAIREVDGTDEPIVANDFPDRIRSISPGVKSFNGRTGDVVPAEGDYTAEQVGALPLSGGTVTGDIYLGEASHKIKALENYSGGFRPQISGIEIFGGSGFDGRPTEINLIPRDEKNVLISPNKRTQLINPSYTLRLSGISDPILDADAANKAYVDSKAGGLSIASNAGAHNSIFRGKYLGSSVTAAQYAAIAAGTFEDLFIGDYWTINNINWRIAAFDYYFGTGSTALTTHHAVIVPDTHLDLGKMNDTNTTTGGYVNSKMRISYLTSSINKINVAFSNHVLTHEFRMSNAVSNGKVSGSMSVNESVVLMSERNVYGQTIMSSECNDGSDNPSWYTYDRAQFPLFALAPEFIQKDRNYYWLRDVVSATYFAGINTIGFASRSGAGDNAGVRPAFSIKG